MVQTLAWLSLRDDQSQRPFQDPTSSSYFYDLTLMTPDGSCTVGTNKMLFSSVSRLGHELHQEEPDFITVDISGEQLQDVVRFVHTGVIDRIPDVLLCQAFSACGISIESKTFKKVAKENVVKGESPKPELIEDFDLGDEFEPKIEIAAPLAEYEGESQDGGEEYEAELSPFEDQEVYNQEVPQPLEPSRDCKKRSGPSSLWSRGMCPHCGKIVKGLGKHILVMHPDLAGLSKEKNFPCTECKKRFRSEVELKLHLKRHREATCCELCGKVCSNNRTLRDHMLALHGSEEDRKYKCSTDGCTKRFVNKNKLLYHENMCKGLKPIKCRNCDSRFPCHNTRRAHELRYHPADGSAPKPRRRRGRQPGIYSATGLFSKKPGDSVSCEVCGKVFKGATCMYIRHSHMLSMHTKEEDKPFKCPTCNKGFGANATLQTHIKALHTADSDKPFLCSLCGKGFAINQKLKEHMQMHENKRQFKCSMCDVAFNTLGNRNAHERSVHLGIKPGGVKASRRRKKESEEVYNAEEETFEERKSRWMETISELKGHVRPDEKEVPQVQNSDLQQSQPE